MNRPGERFYVSVLTALLLTTALAAGATELQPEPDPDHVGIGGGEVTISRTRPKWDVTEPRWRSRQPLYFGLRLGNRGTVLPGVVDESNGNGTGYDVMTIDTDGDGDLKDESVIRPHREEVGRTLSLRTEPVRVAVAYQDGECRDIAVRVAMSGFRDMASGKVTWSAQCEVAELMRGTLPIGGTRRIGIAILDRPGETGAMNACFNDYGADRLRIDLDGNGSLDAGNEDFPLSKAIELDGVFWDLTADAAARSVVAKPSTLPLGSVRVAVTTTSGALPTGTVEFASNEGYAFAYRMPETKEMRIPVGLYRVKRATLRMCDAQRRAWVVSFLMTNAVAVAGKRETVVKLGLPFVLTPSSHDKFKLGVSGCITAHLYGTGGEEYLNVAPLNTRMKPHVKIVDAMEIVAAEGRMEYG